MVYSFFIKILIVSLLSLFFFSCSDVVGNGNNTSVDTTDSIWNILVGSRSSHYGFSSENGYTEHPTPEQLSTVYKNMASQVDSAVPSAIWIVTGVNTDPTDTFPDGTCHVEFRPVDTTIEYTNMAFWGGDRHTPFLNAFDSIGAKIFLQVEPGMANVKQLIKVVLDKYGHHKCVVGFGVDIEWYPSDGRANHAGFGLSTKLTNEELLEWDTLVKSYNPEYRVFVKHWEPEFCGTGPVSDVIYVNDSQNHSSIEGLMGDYKTWATYFSPNDLAFQYGYAKDSTWWGAYEDPFLTIANRICNEFPDRTCHHYWVDFTLNHEKLGEYWK